MSFVVDASVAIKWFIEENLSEEAEAILGHGESLFAPDLLLAEIGNVLWKKVIRGEIAPDQAHEIAAKIEEGVPVLYSMRLLNARALQIALDLDHPIYDCFYLACAEAVDGVLVTADQKLLDISQGTNFESLVRLLGAPRSLGREHLPSLHIPLEKVEEIIRLSKLAWATQGHVRDMLTGGKEFSPVNVKDLDPAFDSPNWVNLLSRVEDLPENELADLLALGWLGQEYSGTEWQRIRERAGSAVRNHDSRYLRYICSLACYLENGLAILRGQP